MPPTIGAAIRFHTSDPVPLAHMIGINPTNIVASVMNFGRSRFSAPPDRFLEIGERGPQPRGYDRHSAIRVAVNHQCGNVIARSSPFANGIAACLLGSTVDRSQLPMARERSIPVLAQTPTPGRPR
jgi:hypothetical protein